MVEATPLLSDGQWSLFLWKLDYRFVQGLGHTTPEERAPEFVTLPSTLGEENQRVRIGRWLEFMEASSWDDIFPIRKMQEHGFPVRGNLD